MNATADQQRRLMKARNEWQACIVAARRAFAALKRAEGAYIDLHRAISGSAIAPKLRR